MIASCAECKQPIDNTNGRRFCNRKCSDKTYYVAKRKRTPPASRVCLYIECNAEFAPHQHNQFYCSAAHRYLDREGDPRSRAERERAFRQRVTKALVGRPVEHVPVQNPEIHRRLNCAEYRRCGDYAVAEGWTGWSCYGCTKYQPVIDRAENYGRHESPAAQMERACPNMSGVDASRMDSQMSRRFKALGWDKHAVRNRKQGGGST